MTSLTSACTPQRTITEYDIPDLGLVRLQSLKKFELEHIRTFPPAAQYSACIAYCLVDEHGDQVYVVNDETCEELNQLDSKLFDCFVDIINTTVLNQVSVEAMVKN